MKALALGADAVMIGAPLARASEAPGQGWYWGNEAHSVDSHAACAPPWAWLELSKRCCMGPRTMVDGTRNIVGALKRAMANCGYLDLKKFQKAEMTIVPEYRG